MLGLFRKKLEAASTLVMGKSVSSTYRSNGEVFSETTELDLISTIGSPAWFRAVPATMVTLGASSNVVTVPRDIGEDWVNTFVRDTRTS